MEINSLLIVSIMVSFTLIFGSCDGAKHQENSLKSKPKTGKVRYDNFKVLRFISHSESGKQELIKWRNNNPGMSFWMGITNVGRPVDIMVSPRFVSMARSISHHANLTSYVFVDNVQKLIDEESKGMTSTKNYLNFTSYATLDNIYKFLDDQAVKHSHISKVISIGKSSEGRDLKVIKISKSNETKPAIWYDALMHSREWISGSTCTFVVHKLLNSDDPVIVKMTQDFDWYIMCVSNPDGYVFTYDGDRLWRKTRSNTSDPDCKGVDPNRNWSFHWNSGGSSNLPCEEDYHGPYPFSEPETKAMAKFYSTIAKRAVFFLTTHSYSQVILLPFAYTNETLPDYKENLRIGIEVKKAIARRYNTNYDVGNVVDLIYVASGASFDWVKGVYNTTLVASMELRDTGKSGMVLPPDQIIPCGLEFMDGLIEFIHQLRLRLNSGTKPQNQNISPKTLVSIPHILRLL